MTYAEPTQLNTLAGTVIWTYRVPGEEVTRSEVIGQMIEAGHTEDYAREITWNVMRAPLPRQRPYVHSTMCHTVRYLPASQTFTYIGR